MTLGTRIVVMKDGEIQQVAPPVELYENPVNKFVAGFIGSPSMNFLEAQVEKRQGRIWLEGKNWKLPADGVSMRKLTDRNYIGKKIILGIRPEDLHEEGEGDACLDLNVDVREMLGSEVLLHGTIEKNEDVIETEDAIPVSAKLLPACKTEAGEVAHLHVDMSRIKLFDTETDENILYI